MWCVEVFFLLCGMWRRGPLDVETGGCAVAVLGQPPAAALGVRPPVRRALWVLWATVDTAMVVSRKGVLVVGAAAVAYGCCVFCSFCGEHRDLLPQLVAAPVALSVSCHFTCAPVTRLVSPASRPALGVAVHWSSDTMSVDPSNRAYDRCVHAVV